MVPRLWARVRQLIASSENCFTQRRHWIVSKREACKKKGICGKLSLKGAKGGDPTRGASWGGLSTTLVELETMLGWANKGRSDTGEPRLSSPCSALPEWERSEEMHKHSCRPMIRIRHSLPTLPDPAEVTCTGEAVVQFGCEQIDCRRTPQILNCLDYIYV
jgi:hypothetical protein